MGRNMKQTLTPKQMPMTVGREMEQYVIVQFKMLIPTDFHIPLTEWSVTYLTVVLQPIRSVRTFLIDEDEIIHSASHRIPAKEHFQSVSHVKVLCFSEEDHNHQTCLPPFPFATGVVSQPQVSFYWSLCMWLGGDGPHHYEQTGTACSDSPTSICVCFCHICFCLGERVLIIEALHRSDR